MTISAAQQIVQNISSDQLIDLLSTQGESTPFTQDLLHSLGSDRAQKIFASLITRESPLQAFLAVALYKRVIPSEEREKTLLAVAERYTDIGSAITLMEESDSPILAAHLIEKFINSSDDEFLFPHRDLVQLVRRCCAFVPEYKRTDLVKNLGRKTGVSDLDLSLDFYTFLGGNRPLISFESLLDYLLSADRFSRRSAKWLISKSVEGQPECPSCQWGAIWRLYDSADEYSSHLFKSLFRELSNLTPCTNEEPYHVSPKVVRIFLSRCLTHENHHVVKFAVHEVSSDAGVQRTLLERRILDLPIFLKAIEATPALFVNKTDCDRISNLIANILKGSPELIPEFTRYTFQDSKSFYPIQFAYLSALVAVPYSHEDIGAISDAALKYATGRMTAFPAVIRPSLARFVKRIILSAFPERVRDIAGLTPFFSLVELLSESGDIVSDKIHEFARVFINDHAIVDGEQIVPFSAVSAAARICVQDESVVEQVQASLTGLHARQYISPAMRERLLFAAIAFKAHLGDSLLHDTLDFERIDMIPVMERLLQGRPHLVPTVRIAANFQKILLKDHISDSEIMILLRDTIYLSKGSLESITSELFDTVFKFNLRRFSDEVINSIHFVTPDISPVNLANPDAAAETFFRFKWKLLTGIVRDSKNISAVRNVDLLDHVSSSSTTALPELLEFVSAISSYNLLENASEFFEEYCALAFGFISNRGSEVITDCCIESLVRLAFFPIEDTSVSLNQARSNLVRKLLTIGEVSNPLIGRIAVAAFVGFLKSASLPEGCTDVLADILTFREAFEETDVEGVEFASNQVWSRKNIDISMSPLEKEFEATSAYSRIVGLVTLREIGSVKLFRQVVKHLMNRIEELQAEVLRKKGPQTPLPFTAFHRMQLRIYQAIAYLAPRIEYETYVSEVEPMLYGTLLTWANQPDARDYLESIAIYFALRFDNHPLIKLIKVLRDFSLSSQSVSSFIVVGGFLVSRPVIDNTSIEERKELLNALLPYLSSHVSYVRGLSQQWLLKSHHNGVLTCLGTNSVIQGLIAFISNNKECIQMQRKLSPVYGMWDPVSAIESGEILSLASSNAMYKNSELLPAIVFMSALRLGVHEAVEDNWFYTRDLEMVINDFRIKTVQQEVSVTAAQVAEVSNSQKKYYPQIGSIFPDHKKDTVELRRRAAATELIVVATLVEKVTNTAGLCRSAEVFGAKKLVVPSMNVLRDSQFSTMSVTAEKWIDIEEVHSDNLAAYLERIKKTGYTVVCLEQTHDSVLISDYNFPEKTCLVLGNEKCGVEAGFLPYTDVCVEIPQKGIIRSLNVHVSGAIAMWQYNRSI